MYDNSEKNYKRFTKVYDLLKCYDFFLNEVLWNHIIVFNTIWIGLYLNSVNQNGQDFKCHALSILCKVKRNLARALSIMTLIFHCSFKFLFQSSSKFLCETKCMVWNVIQSMPARIHCNRDFPSVSRLIAKDCVKIYTKTRTKYPPYNLFLYIDQFRQVLFKYKVLISCLSCQPETYTSKRF